MNALLLLEKEINKCETKMGAHVARLIPDVRTGAELSREPLSGTVRRARAPAKLPALAAGQKLTSELTYVR
jgi:hypothetical protein